MKPTDVMVDPPARRAFLLALFVACPLGIRAAAAQDDYLPAPDSGFLVGTYDLRTPPDVSHQSFESTHILLPAGWPLRVTIAGKLRFTPTCAGKVREIGPAGLDVVGHPYAVTVGVGMETSPPSSTLDIRPRGTSADTVTAFAIGPGVLWATRLGGPRLTCPLSGTQTITATVLPPPIISFDRARAVRGDTVNAHVTVSWSRSLNVRRAWTWIDSAAAPGHIRFVSGCRAGDSTCRLIVDESGHLIVPEILVAGTIPQVARSLAFEVGPAHLVLTAPSRTVPSGSKVMFTARRSDGQPVAVRAWEWKEQRGSSPLGPLAVDCASEDSLCVIFVENTSPLSAPVLQTGTLTAWVLIGTWKDSATVSLTVLPKTREIPPEKRATMTITVVPQRPPVDTVPLFTEALVDEKPLLVSAPQLIYPESLNKAGIEGRVIVQAIIDTLGRAEPGSVKVVLSPNAGFDEPARSYILSTVFRPGRVQGRAVRVLMEVPVIFRRSGP